MALVRLMSAGSHPEAQLVKGLLETEGIPCVINSESRNTEMGIEAGFAEIFLLVNEEHLEHSRLLMEARPVTETVESPGVPSEGAVCPVHEQEATGICTRCGTHLCAACGKVGEPPVCEACDARLSQAPRRRTKTRVIALVMLAVLLGVPLLGGLILQFLYSLR